MEHSSTFFSSDTTDNLSNEKMSTVSYRGHGYLQLIDLLAGAGVLDARVVGRGA